MDHSPLGSSVHGILQARIVEWGAMPSSRGSSGPGDQTCFSCLLHWRLILYSWFFTAEPRGKPCVWPLNDSEPSFHRLTINVSFWNNFMGWGKASRSKQKNARQEAAWPPLWSHTSLTSFTRGTHSQSLGQWHKSSLIISCAWPPMEHTRSQQTPPKHKHSAKQTQIFLNNSGVLYCNVSRMTDPLEHSF